MERNILDCLENNPSRKHILPFFWQHGEEHQRLKEEIDAIQKCGINEFCVESRTHEQFCEEKWWEDFGFILKEAKSRGMRVWLLDDKYFPTGYANNYIQEHPVLRMTSLRLAYYDYVGPQTEMALLPEKLDADESFVSVVAYRRVENGNKLCQEGIELSSNIRKGLLWWDIPDGVWRVYYVIRTHRVCSPEKSVYIDMLSEESCKAMLHGVYEPHYEHFAEYFGNTFAGFFSDEPSFSNDVGNYRSILGKEDMLLPWCDDLSSIIAEKSGRTQAEMLKLLPALWHDIQGRTPLVREAYMEAVTEKYSRNFCFMLGDWCRAHGVMYIGHVIEDMNTHQRLGYGAGHFFRALDGQDMAGIDIVLNQIIPGHLELEHTASVFGKVVEPEFFHYTLAKLASSHSHIQPLKQNRAMCEIYGAFGWAEGIPMMKYLTDHMLVNGINYFVPHAFSPRPDDPDCPPHFYANGTNCQFPLFGTLMEYTARMAHILTDGIHRADVAVYYNAEAEWAGGAYMLEQKVCRVLTRSQIDFDFIPQDVLVNAACDHNRMVVHQESYQAVVVPYSQYLPARVIAALGRLAEQGVPVIFVEKMPDMTSEMNDYGRALEKCKEIPLLQLADALIVQGMRSVNPHTTCETLRFYHIEREKKHLIMFWNEDIVKEIDTNITLPVNGSAVFYDGWRNKVFLPEQNKNTIRVRLAPGENMIVCVGEQQEEAPPYDYREDSLKELSLLWDISIRDARKDTFSYYSTGSLRNLAEELPDFAGVIRYETVYTVEDCANIQVLELGRVGETAQLWINGQTCGACVSAPFRFELYGYLQNGDNTIRIEVMNNLGYRGRDSFSQYLPLPPTGLLGPVSIGKRKEQ